MILDLFLNNPIVGLIVFGSIVIAIAVHEFAHAYAADKLGDMTPRSQGRVTLNPLSHLDPWGTLLILIVGIGWGRPVMFSPHNLKNPRRDTALIAIAGPVSNIIMAVSAALIFHFINSAGIAMGAFEGAAVLILTYFITINLALAIFNMIPIEPLDGFKVLAGILPPHLAYQWEETRKYGWIALIVLLLTGTLSTIVFPAVDFVRNLLIGGIPLWQ